MPADRALAVYDSVLWIATETPGGLLSYDTAEHTWREYPLPEMNSGRRIALTADGRHVWVGTAVGAFYLDVPRRIWTHYTPLQGLIHGNVQAVLRDGDYIWFGTAEGLSRFDWARALFEKKE